jgi:uncharacterized membrane protein
MAIIPNWHPIFVHFTIALLSTALLFMLLMLTVSKESLRLQWRHAARWSLWFGAFFTIFTLIAGFYAFSHVSHDEISYQAMLTHRAWALATVAWLVVVVVWSARCCQQGKLASYGFLLAMILLVGMVISTAWHGAELVYRYGLGVMSLPQTAGHTHDDGINMAPQVIDKNNKHYTTGEESAIHHDQSEHHPDHEH